MRVPSCDDCGGAHAVDACPRGAEVIDLDEVLHGGERSPERIVELLIHVDRMATLEQVKGWSAEERKAASAWGVARHGRNLGLNVRVPATPRHVQALPRLSAIDLKLGVGAPVRGQRARVFDGLEAAIEEPLS